MINNLIVKTGQLLSRNSTSILTAVGATGVVTTAYFAAKASFEASEMLEGTQPDLTLIEKAEIVWPCYIPATITGVVTISSILLSHKVETSRTAAAVSAYSLTERAFSGYKEKVVEEIGKHREQTLRDEIAQDSVTKNPPDSPGLTVLSGNGDVLCCELYTGRYFMSSMESLKKAQNDVNFDIINQLYVTLDSFYDCIGIPHTAHSSELGWDSSEKMELVFCTTLTEDGKPCLAFNYNYVKPI